MSYRALAILALLFVALNVGGCRSSADSQYEQVLMPRQTGSALQRRVEVRAGPEKKSKKKQADKKEKKKDTEKSRKADTEPSASPAPEEESTPAPERFR